MNAAFILLALSILAAESTAAENPIYKELIQKGVRMSDGSTVKLPPPIVPDGLDAAGQWAAMDKVATVRSPVERLVQKSFYAPVVVKVRTVKSSEGEGPAVRTVDLWFVAHGDWDVLTSKEFFESMAGAKDEGPNRVVSKSGTLTDEEMTERKLSATNKDGYEERFVYTTFSLFERVELSATRLAGLTRGKDSWLAAARIDRRFDKDPEYPNQWRALLRDVRAEIELGPAHPFLHAGGYAKITRLKKPAGAVFVECHLAYEEDYGWFDGVNLVKRKVPLMVREKVRTFRRKLAVASEQTAKEADSQ
ncbi:MAG: hypothetical protein KKE86_03240 [Planctomycetes bacterium]|nr:hypothetical protein [Planctomycetota bacterium]MCG2683108.1 hypothetical protein [Planctomycetales bacterium]